ncbi:MAG: terpene cyclase/mutase family protein [Asgard group archaeon]|nr:terpene cyclase/mutase family protein [Asgard group archaeon]
MVDVEKAVDFIKKNGSDHDIAKLNIILEKDTALHKQKLLDYYIQLQNPDGGFPYLQQKNSISTINITTYSLLTMMDYEIDENNTFDSAIEYLYKNQHENGSWNEPLTLIEFKPPIWDDPREPFTPIWLTANVCFLLTRLGFISSPNLKKGINYLLQKKDSLGKIEGFLQSTWLFTASLALIEGSDSKLVVEMLSVIYQNLEKIMNSSNVIWCLQSLLDGGISLKNNIVEKLMQNLISQQKNNGIWTSIDGIDFNSRTTVAVIYILKKLSMLNIK